MTLDRAGPDYYTVALNALPFFCDLDPGDPALLGRFIALSTFYNLVDTCSVARHKLLWFQSFHLFILS